jgi:hypothetical protein
MKYLSIVLSISVIYSQVDEQVFADQGIERTSEFKRGKAYGQDCDDTEYRDYKGYPAWKGYGGWISECDSIRTVNLDREFAEKDKIRQREKAIQDSIDVKEASKSKLSISTNASFTSILSCIAFSLCLILSFSANSLSKFTVRIESHSDIHPP